ncbi:MAG: hypothetical protein ABMB14_33560, partial [Myxococcota bacterium]
MALVNACSSAWSFSGSAAAVDFRRRGFVDGGDAGNASCPAAHDLAAFAAASATSSLTRRTVLGASPPTWLSAICARRSAAVADVRSRPRHASASTIRSAYRTSRR